MVHAKAQSKKGVKELILILCLLNFISSCSTQQKARIVLLPDTQTYAEKYPEILHSQIDWIVKEEKNIDVVLQQGDLTQNNSDIEWKVVREAFTKLDHKQPYVLAVGNHDMGSVAGKFADVRNADLYNRYFPFSRMSLLPGFGGVFEEGRMENAWYLFETGKRKWLILTLEFGPRNAVLDWANGIISRHSDRIAVVNTHSYMYSDSTRQGPKDYWRPQDYGVGKDTGSHAVNDGEDIWRKLVKNHPNIRFVFSGHVLNTGVGTLVSFNEAGLPVYQMLANYQEGVKNSVKGGNGYLRILDLDFKKNTLTVKTYSPYTGQYLTEEGQQFVISEVFFKAR